MKIFGIEFGRTKKLRAQIQALERQQIEILSLVNTVVNKRVRKNNFTTYETQVKYLRDMYNAKSNYGAEMAGSIIDFRTAIIAGEGISVFAEKKKTKKWINNFIEKNMLNGSMLIDMVQDSEIQGKQLLLLFPSEEKDYVKVGTFSWIDNKYKIKVNKKNNKKIDWISYNNDDGTDGTIKPDEAVYVRLGGTSDDITITPSRTAKILTQIINYSQALYDMRNANYLYGYPSLMFKCENDQQAKAISNLVSGSKWKIGQTFASSAQGYYPSPPATYEALTREMMLNLKLISSTTGIPVHFLGWTDLMSNRATAENLMEFIYEATKKERLIWKEKITELIKKAMTMSVDRSLKDPLFDPDGFEVDLPMASLAQIQQLADVFLPLQEAKVISMATLRSKMPWVDPNWEAEQIEREITENKKRMMEDMKTGFIQPGNQERDEEPNDQNTDSNDR